jgi:hypothetical protein
MPYFYFSFLVSDSLTKKTPKYGLLPAHPRHLRTLLHWLTMRRYRRFRNYGL